MPGSKRLVNWVTGSASAPSIGSLADLDIRRCSPFVPRAPIQSRAVIVWYPPARPRRWRARRVSVSRAPVANSIAHSAYTARAATASIDRPGINAVQELVRAAPNTSGPTKAAARIAHAILNQTIIHGRIDGPLLLAHRARIRSSRAMPPIKAVLGGRLIGGCFRWVPLTLHPALAVFARSGRLSSNRTFHPRGANV